MFLPKSLAFGGCWQPWQCKSLKSHTGQKSLKDRRARRANEKGKTRPSRGAFPAREIIAKGRCDCDLNSG